MLLAFSEMCLDMGLVVRERWLLQKMMSVLMVQHTIQKLEVCLSDFIQKPAVRMCVLKVLCKTFSKAKMCC